MSVGIATGRSAAWELRYEVPRTDHTVIVSSPEARPDLWDAYLAGVVEVYGSYGVVPALELDRDLTSLVFVAFDRDGRARGGIRSQGPYDHPSQAQALAVWENDARVRRLVRERLADGLVETKGLWVERDFPGRRELVHTFGRTPVHASTILGARYGLGTTAAHTEALWMSSGAVLRYDVPPVPYPDERYRTHLMFWDRWHLPASVTDADRRALDLETAQLMGVEVPAPRSGR
ncbi:hypothetical protein GCM10023201_20570 [Actinomycetospora corticicola]